MFTVLNCIRGSHDLRLVVVAALICLAAASTGVAAYRRARRAQAARQLMWVGFTGCVAGAGVWATHFTAMLAYEPGLQVRYDAVATLASLAASVLGVSTGFGVAAVRKDRAGALVGGAIAGFGVAAMHFGGMAGVRAEAMMLWDPGLVAVSVTIAVAGFMHALWQAHDGQSFRQNALAVGALVVAITGLHFTAMAAITIVPDPSVVLSSELIGRTGLTALTVLVACLILAGAMIVLWVERFSSRSTLENLREALDSTPVALAFFDGQHQLSFWNNAYGELLSRLGAPARTGLPHRRIVERWRACGASPSFEGWSGIVGQGPPPHLVQEIELADGGCFLWEANPTPDGGFVVVISDTSNERNVRQALAEAKEKAEAVSRAKTAFVANISHEIRTPLNGILGVAHLMQADAAEPVAVERLRMIKNCGETLLAVLNDVLDMSKIEAGKMEIRREQVCLGEVVEASCSAFVPLAAEKGVKVEVRVDPTAGGDWWADGGRLRQVIANLVANAVKFTQDGGVTIHVETAADGVAFAVQDTGVGIAAGELARLFERFEQVDASSTRRHGGTGLGLALCRELVDLMGGELKVESAVGRGSTFSFHLPLARAASGDHRASAPAARATLAPIRVLAADDNATNRYILKALLEPMGVRLTVAEDGRQAVAAYAPGAFDIILMDVQMPELDGVGATMAIRQLEAARQAPRTPIIALSANVLDFQQAQYFASGMDAVVPKPLEPGVLFETLDRCLAAVGADAGGERLLQTA